MGETSAKELLRETIDKLPADASVEEAMERLYFLSKIERGLEQANAGKTLSHEEVRRRLGFVNETGQVMPAESAAMVV